MSLPSHGTIPSSGDDELSLLCRQPFGLMMTSVKALTAPQGNSAPPPKCERRERSR